MSKRYSELNYFNAIACLFVILIHVLSLGITSLQRDSLQLVAIYLPWKFAAYVVPGFLFTGAVKMALGFTSEETSGKRVGYFAYIWRRVTKIYLPYVLWVGIYYVYFLRIGWVENGIDVFFKYVWFGNLSSPFYYVVTVMQFYLLMPLWRWIVKKTPFFTTIPVAALISLAMLRFEALLGHFGIEFLWRDRIFPTYIFFWVVGLYVGKHYEAVRETIKRHLTSCFLLAVPVTLYVSVICWQYANNVYIFDGNPLKLITDVLTIFLLFALCIVINDRAPAFITKPLTFIFSASFTVYLSHCLFLQECQSQLGAHGVTDMGLVLLFRALTCYTLPFILWFVFDWVRGKLLSPKK